MHFLRQHVQLLLYSVQLCCRKLYDRISLQHRHQYLLRYIELCACSPMFYQAMTSLGNPYCDRCFLGCLTCSGPLATNCLTCVSNFTFSSNNSTCSPPSTSNDYSVQLAYYFLNFNLLSNWYWQSTSSTYLLSSSNTYTCNSYTLAGLSRRASNLISNYYSLQTHFEVRVMFSHYFFLSASTT